jgi:methanethiol S-methyltransferase
MLNKTITLPVPPARLNERRRWDRHRPVPERRGSLAYAEPVTIVLAASVLYSIAIIFGLGVPSLRSFPVGLSTLAAVVMDLALLLLALLHFHFVQRPCAVLSMQPLTRSQAMRTQDRLLVSALLLGFFFTWQPLPDLVWALSVPWQLRLIEAGTYAGWMSLLASVALIEVPLFSRSVLRLGLLSCTCSATRVARAGFVCGLLLVEWCTAQMNLGHLLFAGALTAYLVVALFLYRRNVNAALWHSRAVNKGLRLLQG